MAKNEFGDEIVSSGVNEFGDPIRQPASAIPGMEKLGAVPGIPKPPVPTGLQKPEDQPYSFVNPPEGLLKTGWNQAVGGVERMAQPGMPSKYSGASDIIRGLGKIAIPAAVPPLVAGLALAPVATLGAAAVGTAGSLVGGEAARSVAGAVGAGPEATQLAGDVGQVMGGTIGGGVGAKVASWATNPNISRVLNRIYRPTPNDSDFPEVTPQAIADLKTYGGKPKFSIVGRPKLTNEDIRPGGMADTAITNLQNGLDSWITEAKNRGVRLPGDALVQATKQAIPDLMWQKDPTMAASIVDNAQQAFGGRQFDPAQWRGWLKTENASLKSFYGTAGATQSAAAAAGSSPGIENAQANAMRDVLYNYLDPENAGAGPREIQQRTGNLITLRNAADRKSNVILGEKPERPIDVAGQPLTAIGQAWQGRPVQAARTLGHPIQGPSDAALTDIYRASPEGDPIPQPAKGQPLPPPSYKLPGVEDPSGIRVTTGPPAVTGPANRALPPPTLKMLGFPDTSGPSGPYPTPPPNFGSVPQRVLPPASSGIGVSGTIVPDIIGRSSRGVGSPQGLLPPPQPGVPPQRIQPTGPGSIGLAGTVPIRSTQSPIPVGGEHPTVRAVMGPDGKVHYVTLSRQDVMDLENSPFLRNP